MNGKGATCGKGVDNARSVHSRVVGALAQAGGRGAGVQRQGCLDGELK